MSPDDPRHGTVRGYIAHQRSDVPYCADCTRAKARYDKTRKWALLQGRGFTVSSIGARRRVNALRAIGWSRTQIARAAGWETSGSLRYLDRSDTCTRRTHDRIAAVYDRLCMTLPPDITGRRVRTWASRSNLVPPLGWDDIDNDPEPPAVENADVVDPVVVMLLLDGRKVDATKAEKDAAMQQWVAEGGSRAELCRWHGWKEGRYGRPALQVIEGGAA